MMNIFFTFLHLSLKPHASKSYHQCKWQLLPTCHFLGLDELDQCHSHSCHFSWVTYTASTTHVEFNCLLKCLQKDYTMGPPPAGWYIPSFCYNESDLERGNTVFKIEVLMNGRKHFAGKRYSEYHALHKKLKKGIKTPEIPSRHSHSHSFGTGSQKLEQQWQGLKPIYRRSFWKMKNFRNYFLIS